MRAARVGQLAPVVLLALVAAAAGTAAAGAGSAGAPIFLRRLQMLDAVHGYALGGSGVDAERLLRTTDGGRHWTDITPQGTGHNGAFGAAGRTVFFATTLRAHTFVVERSDDGGRSWRRSRPFRDPHGLGTGAPLAVDSRHLYIASGEGAAAGSEGQALYVSSDGGESWRFVSRTDTSGRRRQALPFGCDKNGFGFATPTRGWAGGYCAGGPPFLYRSDDGGRSWRRQRLAHVGQCACETSAPRFFDAHHGAFAVEGFTSNGSGKPILRIYWSGDGGQHWRASDPRASRAGPVSFAGARTAWVVASAPGHIGPPFNHLYRTADAGRHWQTLTLPFDGQNYPLDAVSATLAYAYHFDGSGSSILRSEDGGRRWQTLRTTSGHRKG